MITECQIYITRKCNIHCGYCNLIKKEWNYNELSIEEWKQAFKKLEEIGIKTVKIMGGEPTVIDGLEELLKFINTKTSIKYAILSNSMFDDEKLNSLVSAGLQGYFASIDGIEDVKSIDEAGVTKSHAGFEKLKKFREKGVKILGANVVINKQNISDLPEIVKILSDNGIWINLCPIIHGKESFWEFRTDVPDRFKFTEEDIPKINDIMVKLLQLKIDGCKIAVPDSYLINMSKYGIHLNWKCTKLVQLRIDADGALMVCNDIRGEVAKKYNILDLDNETYNAFKIDWYNEKIRQECSGCYWSCFLHAEDNLKNNKLEFDYQNDRKY